MMADPLLAQSAVDRLSAGVGFLPVLAGQHHLGPLAAGTLVSLLAAAAAVLHPPRPRGGCVCPGRGEQR